MRGGSERGTVGSEGVREEERGKGKTEGREGEVEGARERICVAFSVQVLICYLNDAHGAQHFACSEWHSTHVTYCCS